MKALRIVLKQSSANYRKEETLVNKMTYPLPPVSTVIGAIHNACNYREYHEMDVSIQGKYESMHKEAYTERILLDSLQNDRGILVKMKNEGMFSNAYDEVARAKKNQGNDFFKGITISVTNEELLKEYRDLKALYEKIKEYKKSDTHKKKLEHYKSEKARLSKIKKETDKKSTEFEKIKKEERKIKEEEKAYKDKVKNYEEENYTIPMSKFKTVVTSLKYYEILNNIDLIIHIRSDEKTLNDIYDNIYCLKSIGRSEDFVDVTECKLVELEEDDDCDVTSEYSAYLNYDDVYNKNIYTDANDDNIIGTKYYINKNYEIKDKRREFKKKKVVYTSEYSIVKTSVRTYIDRESDKEYIVNFI